MPPRAFGAVVPNVADELGALGTIQLRNERAAVDPLHPDFLSMLLEPATACRVYRKRKAWRELAIALDELIERAIDKHWRTAGSVHRLAYSWRDREAAVLCDYPAWAHRAARYLLRQGGNIFQHGSEAGPDAGVLLYMARSLSGAGAHVTDAQLLAGLAIREAVFAARELVQAVREVDSDSSVCYWREITERPEWRARSRPDADVADRLAADKLEGEAEAAIDRAAINCFYPVVADITQHRIHAEQLLLLADIVATGGMSGKQAAQTLSDLSQARAEGAAALDGREKAEDKLAARLESERQAKAQQDAINRAKANLMAKARRKVTEEMEVRILELLAIEEAKSPRPKVETMQSDVAKQVSREFGVETKWPSVRDIRLKRNRIQNA
ncbi:hypothetical protein [Cupriavidus basilensis]